MRRRFLVGALVVVWLLGAVGPGLLAGGRLVARWRRGGSGRLSGRGRRGSAGGLLLRRRMLRRSAWRVVRRLWRLAQRFPLRVAADGPGKATNAPCRTSG